MGTKLQAATDLLATKTFIMSSNIRYSMERAFKQRGVEGIKTTMLKQEEIFNHQVRELHRLYSVQRALMEEMKYESNQQSKCSTTPTTASQGNPGLGYSFCIQNERDHQSRLGGDTKTRIDFSIIRRADHQEDNTNGTSITAVEAAAVPSMIVQELGIAQLEEDLCGVDLTLSIGGVSGSSKKRLKELKPNHRIGFYGFR